jgi:hypothetical protein
MQNRFMSTKKLERAVQDLPAEEFASFAAWFEEYLADRWDEEMEQDIAAGRLEGLAEKAKQDYREGRCTPL